MDGTWWLHTRSQRRATSRLARLLLELLILVVVLGAVLFALCYKKTIIEPPFIEHIPGQYHLTLAPQLPREFIRQLCQQAPLRSTSASDIPSQYFTVDEHNKSYLLAISLRDNTCYCQAIQHTGGDAYQAIRHFAEAVLVHHPVKGIDQVGIEQLNNVVAGFAQQSGVAITKLS